MFRKSLLGINLLQKSDVPTGKLQVKKKKKIKRRSITLEK